MTLDVSTATATLERIQSDDAWRADLVENARGVATQLLCAACIGSYVVAVLASLKHQLPELNAVLNPKEASAKAFHKRRQRAGNATQPLAKLLEAGNCERLMAAGLVEVVSTRPSGRRAPSWSVTTKLIAKDKEACAFLAKMSTLTPSG